MRAVTLLALALGVLAASVSAVPATAAVNPDPSATGAGASAGTCSRLSANGVDYLDANLTVVAGANPAACCEACSMHAGCNVAVWHNVRGGLCALKASGEKPLQSRLVSAWFAPPPPPPPPSFRFASVYSDAMVLQAAPLQSRVWGFCEEGDEVQVKLDTGRAGMTWTATVDGDTWSAIIPAIKASFDSHTVTATSAKANASVTISDVLFGDVWICSGQSNMAYS